MRAIHITRRSATLGVAAMLVKAPAMAQDAWPSRPIKLVAPSAPCGATDSVGRILGRYMEQQFKQAVVVEARPGAGAVLGAQHVKQSPADGYTFLISGSRPQIAAIQAIRARVTGSLKKIVASTEAPTAPASVRRIGSADGKGLHRKTKSHRLRRAAMRVTLVYP